MLSKKLIVVLLAALLLASVRIAPAQAQADPWRVTIFDRNSGQFYDVTAAGLQLGSTLALDPSTQIWEAELAPDKRYFVFSDSNKVKVADLSTGACCTTLAAPDPALRATYISPISPDGSQIAISMSSDAIFTTPGLDLPVMVFDLASGQVVATLMISQLQNTGYQASAVQFGGWRADGLRVIPSCWGCEGTWEGSYQVWNPAANTLSGPLEPFNIVNRVLPGTGEVLKGSNNPAYPQSGFPSAYFDASNVVEYLPSVTAPAGTPVYFDPASVYVSNLTWVAGGQAFLVATDGPAHSSADNVFNSDPASASTLVFRDGHTIAVNMPGFYASTGTPDGWMARNWQTGELAQVQLLPGDQVQITPLNVSITGDWLIVGTNFDLGATATASPFPPVTPPTFAACPGFVTSRLWPNTFAAVSPGDANNLRDQPSSSGAKVGSIPGGEMFAVLNGPQCAENMAWWYVEYKGQTGWTSEGQGSTYWLQPVGGMQY